MQLIMEQFRRLKAVHSSLQRLRMRMEPRGLRSNLKKFEKLRTGLKSLMMKLKKIIAYQLRSPGHHRKLRNVVVSRNQSLLNLCLYNVRRLEKKVMKSIT